MAAGRPQDNHGELWVQIEQAKRDVVAAVELEKKEIIKPNTTSDFPIAEDGEDCTVEGTSASSDADRVVGIVLSPHGVVQLPLDISNIPEQILKQKKTITTKPSPPTLDNKIVTDEFTSIRQNTENLIEYFQDHDKQKDIVNKSLSKRPRTPSPSPIRQSIGIDHLDNLVRLMKQLSNLRDENVKLKSRCEYLESTKTLLQAKSSLDDDVLLVIHTNSLTNIKKEKSLSTKSRKSDCDAMGYTRARLSSAEDTIGLEDFCASSDQAPKRSIIGKLYKRSFSTGSLEVPSDIKAQCGKEELGSRGILEAPFEFKRQLTQLSKSPQVKRKSKFSKWARVKKVLTKPQLSENISSGISSGIKSIKGLKRGAYMRYGSVSGRELAVPSVAESRSVDSGVGSGMDGELFQDVRKSTSSGEPPSPTRFTERHIDVPTPQVEDCIGIWLGPPEWIEKEREREQQLLRGSKTLIEYDSSEQFDVQSPHSVREFEEGCGKILQVPIPRRQSSPLLLDELEDNYDGAQLKRSSSYKEQNEGHIEYEEPFYKSDKGSEKKNKTTWGKMKNIINTGRKDNLKKHTSYKGGDEGDSFRFEEVSDIDLEILEDLRQVHEGYIEGPVGRSTPKTSPVVFRQNDKDKSRSPSASRKNHETAGKMSIVSLEVADTSELLDKTESHTDHAVDSSAEEMEEAFTSVEMQRQSVNLEEIQRKLTDSFSRKMEEWERQKVRRHHSQTADIYDTPQTTKGSFKDRPKSKKSKEDKEKERLEKIRERELMRVEREQQKLEKERIRIEKERLKALEREAKIEKMKGRLSQPDMDAQLKNPVLSPLQEYKITSDFARKLHEWEIRKGKDSMSTAVYLEAQKRSLQFATEYQNAANMLSKPSETLSREATDTDTPHIRKSSCESEELFTLEEPDIKKETKKKKINKKPPPLTLIPFYESPDISPSAPLSDESSLDDLSTETFESMTQANIASLEKANAMLLEQLRQKEIEYCTLQEEVKDLNERVISFKDIHTMELDQYKKQLVDGFQPGEMTLDTKSMAKTLSHLEDKIVELHKFGEQLAMSMEGAAIGKFQTVEGEESINNRLVDLLDKMRLLLQQASYSGKNTLEEVSKKSSALRNFEKLYSQAMQLQVQMNNLRLSQLERNKEIMNMKRHLLMQEANNLVLQADVTRREAELLHYRQYAQRRAPIKRWNTYSCKEDRPMDYSPKQTVYQRVQKLRSSRIVSSTTDSDSDVPTKSPVLQHRYSPKGKRESTKKFKRDSPKTRKVSPIAKKKELPLSRKQESLSKYAVNAREPERSEYSITDSLLKTFSEAELEDKNIQFINTPLAAGKLKFSENSSVHETDSLSQISKVIPETVNKYEVSDGTQTKFPDRKIHTANEQTTIEKDSSLQNSTDMDRNEVFESENNNIEKITTTSRAFSEDNLLSNKYSLEDKDNIIVNISFNSSETSEDTLKQISPDASPGVKLEPLKFPEKNATFKKTFKTSETASDPGSCRPNSLIKATVSSTTPILLRKPPFCRDQTSRLNTQVYSLRRIKPAQELLEESQKYRSGHSIYLTRILKRYPMKIECRSRILDIRHIDYKENIKKKITSTLEGNVLKGTIEQNSSMQFQTKIISEFSVHNKDSSQSNFDENYDMPAGPIKDNDNAPFNKTYDRQGCTSKESFKNTNSNCDQNMSAGIKDSKDVALKRTTSSSTLTSTPIGMHGKTDQLCALTTSKMIYASLPMLSLESDYTMRERSATTSRTSKTIMPTQEQEYSLEGSTSQKHKMHVAVSLSPGRSRRVINPNMSPAGLRRYISPSSQRCKQLMLKVMPIEVGEDTDSSSASTQLKTSSSIIEISNATYHTHTFNKDKYTYRPFGVLCNQSMTFDGSSGEEKGTGCTTSTIPKPNSTSNTSLQSEIETATDGQQTDKKKSRHKFLDSAFIQKSRRFFKVSKENHWPSIECCGSDKERLLEDGHVL